MDLKELQKELIKYQRAHKQNYDSTLRLEGAVLYIQELIKEEEKLKKEEKKDVN